ncbi:MAG: lipopolysaccharide biosynthesis protein [Gemmatimonadales bacterium]|nr:lipopolysaccharide biosynthesis protein [Gemmatimonadales bacterium]MDQ3427138.1 lipopolysaccharide biosynthesis protein [Gemmatimonadota bacterium]
MSVRPTKRKLARSTLSGVTSQYTVTAVNGIVQIGVLALLARLLSPRDFGQVGLATAYIGFWSLAARLGLTAAIVRRPALTERDIRAGFTLAVLLGLTAAGLVWVTAPLAARALGSASLTGIIRALGLSLAISGLSTVADALVQRQLAWARLVRVDLASTIVGQSAVSCVLAALGLGPWSLVGGTLASSAIRGVLLLRTQPHAKRPLFAGTEIRHLLRYGGNFALARGLNYAAQQGDNVVVGRTLGLEALGFYSRAFKLMMMPVSNFGLILTRVLFPIMARIQGEAERVRTGYLTGLAVLSLVTGPLSALMVTLAPEIVLVLLGSKWLATVVPFQILSLGLVLRNPNLMTYTLDGAPEALGKRSLREGVYAIAVVGGALAGARFGMAGVACGVLFGVVVNYAAGTSISLQLTGCSFRDHARAQIPGMILGLAAAAIALPTRMALQAAGAPAPAILALVSLATAAGLGGLLFLYPNLIGNYGRMAIRLSGAALSGRLTGSRLAWLDGLSRGVVRRWGSARPAGADGQTTP